MSNLIISPIYLSFNAILLVVLSMNVVRVRKYKGVALLDGGLNELSVAIRAQGNLTEFAPMFLVLLVLLVCLELNQCSVTSLHTIGTIFCIGRVLHALSILFIEPKFKIYYFRISGMALTFGGIIACVVRLIF